MGKNLRAGTGSIRRLLVPRRRATIIVAIILLIAGLGAVGLAGTVGAEADRLHTETHNLSSADEGEPVVELQHFERPDTVEPGAEITVSAEVVNTGDDAATADVQYRSEWGEPIVQTVQLDPGEREVVTETVEVPEEEGTFGHLFELPEQNEQLISYFAVDEQQEATADLRIRGVTAPSAADFGETVTVAFEVVNEGDETAEATVDYDGDNRHERWAVDLDPGESEQLATEVDLDQPDTFSHTIMLQSADQEFIDIVVTSTAVDTADLGAITIVDSGLPTDLHVDETVSFEATVRNDGDEALHVPVAYLFEGTTHSTETVEVEPGASESIPFQIPPGIPEGTYQHAIQVGDTQVTEELSVSHPDHDALSLEADLPTEVVEGEQATVEATLQHDGDQDITVNVEYLIDGNPFETERVTLEPDGSESVVFETPSGIPEGTWTHAVRVGGVEIDTTLEVREPLAYIDELEEEIAELEAELADAEVSIDVTVEPADAQTFQVGGYAEVSVDVDGASPSAVSLGFAGEEYTPEDGSATIPLETAGEHELHIAYEEHDETIGLDVEASEDDGVGNGEDDVSDGDDTATDEDDGLPGFGVVLGILGLLGAIGLRRHL